MKQRRKLILYRCYIGPISGLKLRWRTRADGWEVRLLQLDYYNGLLCISQMYNPLKRERERLIASWVIQGRLLFEGTSFYSARTKNNIGMIVHIKSAQIQPILLSAMQLPMSSICFHQIQLSLPRTV